MSLKDGDFVLNGEVIRGLGSDQEMDIAHLLDHHLKNLKILPQKKHFN